MGKGGDAGAVNYAKDGAFDRNYLNAELLLLAFHFILEKAIGRDLSNTLEKKGSKKEKGRKFSFLLDRYRDAMLLQYWFIAVFKIRSKIHYESIFLPIAVTCSKRGKITRTRCDWIWFCSSLVEKRTGDFLANHTF